MRAGNLSCRSLGPILSCLQPLDRSVHYDTRAVGHSLLLPQILLLLLLLFVTGESQFLGRVFDSSVARPSTAVNQSINQHLIDHARCLGLGHVTQ